MADNDGTNVATLVTDVDFARTLKEQLRTALEPVHALINEVTCRDLLVGMQLGRDQFGRSVTLAVTVTKEL